MQAIIQTIMALGAFTIILTALFGINAKVSGNPLMKRLHGLMAYAYLFVQFAGVAVIEAMVERDRLLNAHRSFLGDAGFHRHLGYYVLPWTVLALLQYPRFFRRGGVWHIASGILFIAMSYLLWKNGIEQLGQYYH